LSWISAVAVSGPTSVRDADRSRSGWRDAVELRKLPNNVIPALYHTEFHPDLDRATIAGSEAIDIEVRETTDRIELNAAIAVAAREELKVCRLSAGERWIRTSGSAREGYRPELSSVIYVPETVRVLPDKYTVATALAALVELHQNAKRSPCYRRRP
jgi:hypothetical protein